MSHVSPEYQQQLDNLAQTLCPLNEAVEISPLTIPRDEWDFEYEYSPFQEIVPDTRVGFDETGNWHAVEHFTVDGLSNAITPFKWAEYLQDALTQYVGNFEYTVGASERDDIVQDLVAERMEQLDSTLECLQLEKALEIWRTTYGRGYRIRE